MAGSARCETVFPRRDRYQRVRASSHVCEEERSGLTGVRFWRGHVVELREGIIKAKAMTAALFARLDATMIGAVGVALVVLGLWVEPRSETYLMGVLVLFSARSLACCVHPTIAAKELCLRAMRSLCGVQPSTLERAGRETLRKAVLDPGHVFFVLVFFWRR